MSLRESDTPALWEGRARCSPIQERLLYLGTTLAYDQVFRSNLPTHSPTALQKKREHLPITNTKDLAHLPETKAIFIQSDSRPQGPAPKWLLGGGAQIQVKSR